VNLSLALNQQGRYDASIAAAQQALKLKASSAEAWNNISADQAAMHHWPQAVDAARQAIALRPDFQLARNNLAWALQQQATSAAH
jgi:tetratricopeptide (TPR) repeat protein